MKKLKLGTRVLVNGVETFISELHADIERGVYKVRTDNPTYEFLKQEDGRFRTVLHDGSDKLKEVFLEEAPKYSNYQVGDRVSFVDGVNRRKRIKGSITEIHPNCVCVNCGDSNGVPLDYELKDTSHSKLKKLRVKLGEPK